MIVDRADFLDISMAVQLQVLAPLIQVCAIAFRVCENRDLNRSLRYFSCVCAPLIPTTTETVDVNAIRFHEKRSRYFCFPLWQA
jgi:hypothetical protein